MKFLQSFLISSLLFLSQPSYAEESAPLPTQFQIATQGIANFFWDIPVSMTHNFLSFLGMDDFNFLVHHHYQNPVSSPFRVFLGNQHKRLPTQDDYFPFVNLPEDFDDLLEVQYGLCSGVAAMHRRFNMLAYYDPENLFNQPVPSKETHYLAWYKFYQDKINQIARLQPTIIPGFRNLAEFSESELNTYIRKVVVNEWVHLNINLSGLVQLRGIRKNFHQRDATRLYDTIKKRLSLGYNPIIYLAMPGDYKGGAENWIHVLQVTSLSEMQKDGGYSFRVTDINEYDVRSADREVIIHYDQEEQNPKAIWVHDFSELSAVYLVPTDDREVTQMVKNKLEWCNFSQYHRNLCLRGELPQYYLPSFNN